MCSVKSLLRLATELIVPVGIPVMNHPKKWIRLVMFFFFGSTTGAFPVDELTAKGDTQFVALSW